MPPFENFENTDSERNNHNNATSKLFLDAFEPTKASMSRQSLPVDDRPDREEFVMFLYDMAKKYDLNKHTWSHTISSWLGKDNGSTTGRAALDWNSIQRAERDPVLSEKEHKWLGIVERNFDTFRYLNPYGGDFLNSLTIDSGSIEPFRRLTRDSEFNANVEASYENARIKSLGLQGFSYESAASLHNWAIKNYIKNIRPKIEKLVDELKTEPTEDLLKLAKEGNADAQFECSKYYMDGVKTYEVDNQLSTLDREQLQKALPWLYAAARQGHEGALYSLANEITEDRFVVGNGFTDAALVVKGFFEKEAKNGDKLAQDIFQMLQTGCRNEVAAQLFEKAAEQGNSNAVKMLGQMVKGLNEYGMPLEQKLSVEAQQRYEEALERLAVAGNVPDKARSEAMVSLGEINELGVTGQKDYGKAEVFYRRAAELGNKEAQLHMGIINYEGVVVQQDLVESAKWFQKAHDVVDWQLTQLLNNRMGCAAPASVFAGARASAKTIESAEARESVLSKIQDSRPPYDLKMIEFAKKAAKSN